MEKHNGLLGAIVAFQAWAVGLTNWFISVLPTIILIMSAVLTGMQLYVFMRDKLFRKEAN